MSSKRMLYEIAENIISVWYANRAKKHANKSPSQWREIVYFGAVPYLEALLTMRGQEGYGYDSTDSVILYALSNMSTFRGPEARALKDELRTHLSRDYG